MKKKLIAILLMAAMVLSLTACGGGSGDSKSDSEPEKKEYIEKDKISDMFSNPDNYVGKYVKLSGQVFNKPENDGKNIAYQAWYDIENAENDFIFYVKEDVSFSSEDYVIVDGKITGSFKGENAFGAEIKCPEIEAVNAEKSTYMDAVVPTLSEAAPENAVSEQNGISLKVDKIEFAEKETRVYLTAANGTSDKFGFSVYDIKILQNGQQIAQDTNSMSAYYGKYPELSYDVLPNVSTSGVLVFPPIDSSAAFQIYAEGYSDNWELDFAPFTIDIEAL